jgi:Tol biopolymer transport system component
MSDRDGQQRIYVMNADGSGVTRLTNGPGSDADPAWSPDGYRIAFESSRDTPGIAGTATVVGFSNFEIYVMNADGSDQTRLTFTPYFDLKPSWSPDGSRIAFTSSDDIYVMNADGSDPIPLAASSAFDDEAAWSPDGSKIAFTSNRDGPVDIYVMNADGSEVTRLTNPPANQNAVWSPDGSKIAFQSSSRDVSFDIYTMNADGSDITPLTTDPEFDGDPAWLPGGQFDY